MMDAAMNDKPEWDDESDDGRRYTEKELQQKRAELVCELMDVMVRKVNRKTTQRQRHDISHTRAWATRMYTSLMPAKRGSRPGPQHRNGRHHAAE
jgi:hypothetical protein